MASVLDVLDRGLTRWLRPGPVVIGFCVVVAVCCAPLLMEILFGCDECLPAEMQTACGARAAGQEARDRATYERLKEQYGWE